MHKLQFFAGFLLKTNVCIIKEFILIIEDYVIIYIILCNSMNIDNDYVIQCIFNIILFM